MKSKKAIIFSISLVLITLGALVSLLIIINKLEQQTAPGRVIGERSLELLTLESEVEKVKFFIEESAKIAADKAFKKLKSTSGLQYPLPCGVIKIEDKEYPLWNIVDINCFETDFYENYEIFFNKELNLYIDELATTKNLELPSNNYDLFIKDKKELSGIARAPIKVRIKGLPTEPASLGEYAIKASFTVPFKHDLLLFKELRKIVKNVIACKEKTTHEDRMICVDSAVTATSLKISHHFFDETTVLFDIDDELRLGVMLPPVE